MSQKIWIKSLSRMRSLAKIKSGEAEYVYTYMRVACLLFRSSLRHQMAQVAIGAEVAPVWVVVHPCLCAPRVSVNVLLCHCGKEGSSPCDFREPLPGGFRL